MLHKIVNNLVDITAHSYLQKTSLWTRGPHTLLVSPHTSTTVYKHSFCQHIIRIRIDWLGFNAVFNIFCNKIMATNSHTHVFPSFHIPVLHKVECPSIWLLFNIDCKHIGWRWMTLVTLIISNVGKNACQTPVRTHNPCIDRSRCYRMSYRDLASVWRTVYLLHGSKQTALNATCLVPHPCSKLLKSCSIYRKNMTTKV